MKQTNKKDTYDTLSGLNSEGVNREGEKIHRTDAEELELQRLCGVADDAFYHHKKTLRGCRKAFGLYLEAQSAVRSFSSRTSPVAGEVE